MIRLNKGEKPDVLEVNSGTWKDDLLGYIQRNEKIPKIVGGRYNCTEVKQALKAESYSKCMYCESKVSHVSYEHIEHIKPKAKTKFPELTFEWENLGLACPVCNMNKSDEYDNELPILNPYTDSPEEFLLAAGPYIYARPGKPRGKLTEQLLGLNRIDLVEQRIERVETIRRLVDNYMNERNETLKKLLLKEVVQELKQDKPYSFVINSLINIIGIEVA